MKQKSRFVKAGPTTVEVVYPREFRELCRHFDISPEKAIQKLVDELCICGVHFSANSEAQAIAGMFFKAMVGGMELPDEPSLLKREIAGFFLLQLIEVNEQKINDKNSIELVYKEIIRNWYLEYQKNNYAPTN